MIYSVELSTIHGSYTVHTEAENKDEAEQIFIANLDSGDYDHLVGDNDVVCGDIQQKNI